MKKYILFPLVMLLMTAAPLYAAPGDSHSPTALGIMEETRLAANAKFQAGQYEQAYQMYAGLLSSYPQHNALLLGLARAGMLAGHPSEALAAYEKLQAQFPNDLLLYQEISMARVMAGNQEVIGSSSRMEVIDSDSLPTPEQMRASAIDDQRLQMHGRLNFGVMYDSNANNGPSSSILRLGQFPYPVDIGHSGKEKGTMAAYLGLGLDVGYNLDNKGSLWWVSSGNFFIRGNSNPDLADINSREWQWGKLNTGLRYIDEKNFVDLRVKGEVFDYELNSRVWATGPEFTYARMISPIFQLITQLSMDYRDYVKDNARDGIYLSAGQYGRLFFGEDKHSVTIGGRYRGGFTDHTDFSYNGWEVSGRLNFKLSYNFELSPFLSYGIDYYNGPATSLEVDDREDKRLSAGLGFSYHITSAWSAELMYQYVNNHSKSDFYDYDQHVISCGMSYSF